MNYLRLQTRDQAGQRRTVTLEVFTETAQWITGREVRKDGSPLIPRGEADERVHVIDVGAVTVRTELVMDRHYGELVDPGLCEECGWDVEGEGHSPTCSLETDRCPRCGRDWEGCPCRD